MFKPLLKSKGVLVCQYTLKNTLILLILLHASKILQGQDLPINNCGSEHIHHKKLQQDTSYLKKLNLLNEQTIDFAQKMIHGRISGENFREESTIYTVPVVVHIIHNGGTENISDAIVKQGIKDLNDAFRKVSPFNGFESVDVGIEFCLAQKDPFGNPTTGIVRVGSSLTQVNLDIDDQNLKNLSRWDTYKYLNIWLVKEICSGTNCGVAGYAYFASAHGRSFDGIVNEARYFGSSQNNSKVHIHEVGHYLNLYHTFNGGCTNNNCLNDGDRVCDTPPDNSTSAVYCSSTSNSCTSDANDLSSNNPFRPVSYGGLGDRNDMNNNYMDYNYQSCQNAFTQGQKDRMIAALIEIRQSLLNNGACNSPITNTSPTVSITSPANNSTFGPESTITITANASDSDGSITKVEFFQGAIKIGEDISSPYSHTWNNVPVGNYSLTAKATDNSGTVSFSSVTSLTIANCSASGTILREYWANIPGKEIASIPLSQTPTSSSQLSSFEGPSNFADNYGSRIRGYLCPPSSGYYTFFVASDDNSEVWLSSDENPANKTKIAYVTGWTYKRQWDRYLSQKSAPQNLIAGKKYYIEVLHKDGAGGDNVAVGWQLPNATLERPIPGPRLSPFKASSAYDLTTTLETSMEEIQIHPNPSHGTITIQYNSSEEGNSIMKVLSIHGSMVYSATLDNTSVNQELNLSHLENGIYFVQLVTGQKSQTKKIVLKK